MGKGKSSQRGVYFGNGFASLFEDEIVLCGDGRLDEGNYKFEYQIKFPNMTLPSSIDFERGTVSYMLTATLTRPNSISPVMFDDQKIFFNERIDVARLLPPKPRTINLEPMLKRTHTKSSSKRKVGTGNSIRNDDSVSVPANMTPRSLTRLTSDQTQPRSPSPSVRSLESRQSSGPTPSEHGSYVRSSRASDGASTINFASVNGKDGRQITVTVESLRGGILRGDVLPLHIVVRHTKHIKSMQGVIVTLYRQARVDLHPALPLGPTTAGERHKFEDYYPKSRTGLGGLSLSGAGSSHLFRKDLSQVAVPLIVDPISLTAELHPKIRVPDDAFPTINCVPGAMISFNYHIEIIVDIQGKLGGMDKFFAQQDSIPYGERSPGNPMDSNGGGSERYMHSSYYSSFVDTTAIRREKSVVSCILEVVVGTEDSERAKGKSKVQPPQGLGVPSTTQLESLADPLSSTTRSYEQNAARDQLDDQGHYEGYDYEAYGDETYDPQYYGMSQWNEQYDPDYEEPPEFVPPETTPEHELTEKERLRRAEAVLLPSQPPDEVQESWSRPSLGPSAPSLGGEGDVDSYGRPSASCRVRAAGANDEMESARIPRYSQIAAAQHHAPVDKEELRRRELESQASAPPPTTMAADGEGDGYAPLVPHEHDLDGHNTGTSDHNTTVPDHLPRYER